MDCFEPSDGVFDAPDGYDSHFPSHLLWKFPLEFAKHSATQRFIRDNYEHSVATPGKVPNHVSN